MRYDFWSTIWCFRCGFWRQTNHHFLFCRGTGEVTPLRLIGRVLH